MFDDCNEELTEAICERLGLSAGQHPYCNEEALRVYRAAMHARMPQFVVLTRTEPSDDELANDDYDELDEDYELIEFLPIVSGKTYQGIQVRVNFPKKKREDILALADVELVVCDDDELDALIDEYRHFFWNFR